MIQDNDQQRRTFAQLGGATEHMLGEKQWIVLIANRLMTCETHHGLHHFAVTDEGNGILLSKDGVGCVKDLVTR